MKQKNEQNQKLVHWDKNIVKQNSRNILQVKKRSHKSNIKNKKRFFFGKVISLLTLGQQI